MNKIIIYILVFNFGINYSIFVVALFINYLLIAYNFEFTGIFKTFIIIAQIIIFYKYIEIIKLLFLSCSAV